MKRLTILNVIENVKQLEFSCTTHRVENDIKLENSLAISFKEKTYPMT